MSVRPYRDDDAPAVASLSGLTAAELRDRDANGGDAPLRWVAEIEGEVVAAATAMVRPDERTFLRFVGSPDRYEMLAQEARRLLGRPVYASADESDGQRLSALEDCGFRTEMVAERFRVPFVDALGGLRRSWLPSWARIISAADADPDRLFALDNELRDDVPGTDGWRGNRDWFDDELSEAPPFDPGGYLVAVDARSDEYVGLVRIWRNPDIPNFGMVGVRRSHRRSTVAGALIREALLAAATWGHDSFETGASLSNPVTYPRLRRIANERLGRSHQLILR